MDIFKLIFEHDLRLDQLRERQLDRSVQEVSGSIEDFLKPDPTYSKFYITGTDLKGPSFGVNILDHYEPVIHALENGLDDYELFIDGNVVPFKSAVESAEIGDALILSKKDTVRWSNHQLRIDSGSNVGHKKSEIADVLEEEDLVLYKEKAHQGFDLHLFSKTNMYPKLFYPLKELISESFRFFSINGKRINSERTFYFETWSLQRPPHGAEEVFEDTML